MRKNRSNTIRLIYCLTVLSLASIGLSISPRPSTVNANGNNPSNIVRYVSFQGTGTGDIDDGRRLPNPCGNPGDPLVVEFNVNGLLGAVTRVRASADFDHPWVGDLVVSLRSSPQDNGPLSHTLFGRTGVTTANGCGASSDLDGEYAFDDDATGLNWWDEAFLSETMTPGAYKATSVGGEGQSDPAPNTSIDDTFNTIADPNGIWELVVRDWAHGDTGRINSATLEIATTAAKSTKSDFDGDGRTDVSIFRRFLSVLADSPEGIASQWWILRSSDSGYDAFTFGEPNDLPITADLTGDGVTDIAFFRPSTGEWHVLRSEDLTYYAFPFGEDGDIPAPGYFDDDGIADPAVYRPGTGIWFILRSSDSAVTATPFGGAEDKPVVADYDGDGMDDIALFRPSAQEWWLLGSRDGVSAYQFGAPGDKTVQGDYTGDGKADVAFFRPLTGEWFVIRSEDGSFYSFPWGAPGDVGVPGDYDGDGRFDAAVWRASENGTWFINGSRDGFQAVPFGRAGDLPVPSITSAP